MTEAGTLALERGGQVRKNNVSTRDGDYSLLVADRTTFAPDGHTSGESVSEGKVSGPYTNTVDESSKTVYAENYGSKVLESQFTLTGTYSTGDKVTRAFRDGAEDVAAARRVVESSNNGTLQVTRAYGKEVTNGEPTRTTVELVGTGKQTVNDRVSATYGVWGDGWRELKRESHLDRVTGPSTTTLTQTVSTFRDADNQSEVTTKYTANLDYQKVKFDGTARDNTYSVEMHGANFRITGRLSFSKSATTQDTFNSRGHEEEQDLVTTWVERGGRQNGQALAGELDIDRTYHQINNWSSDFSSGTGRKVDTTGEYDAQVDSHRQGTLLLSTETVSSQGFNKLRTVTTEPGGTPNPETVYDTSWNLTGTQRRQYRWENGVRTLIDSPPAWQERPYAADSVLYRAWTWRYTQDTLRIVGGAVEVGIGLVGLFSANPAGIGFGAFMIGMGIDNIYTGIENIRTGQSLPSAWDFAWQYATGYEMAGPLAATAVTLGPWGISRIWQLGRTGRGALAAERSGTRLLAAEEIAGEYGAIPTAADRAEYATRYSRVIQEFQAAGRQGITVERLLELEPGLAALLRSQNPTAVLTALLNESTTAFAQRFWTMIGQVSGAVRSFWSVREVGVWVGITRIGPPTIVINMGQPAYLARAAAFFFRQEEVSLIPRFMRPRLYRPFATDGELMSHLGHSHPIKGLLQFSSTDEDLLHRLFLRTMGMPPEALIRQPRWAILAGPTGDWRRVPFDVPGLPLR